MTTTEMAPERCLIVHAHLDDFHGDVALGFPQDAADAADLIVAFVAEGYDVSAVTYGGEAWERIPYGAGWSPKIKRGWQTCHYCKGYHPVTSEC